MGPAFRLASAASFVFVQVLIMAALEPARAEPATASATRPSFSARVWFLPPDATVPTGFLLDTGAAFGERPVGPAHGWTGDNWELAVADGYYVVRLIAHPPAKVKDLGDDVDIEGVGFLSGASGRQRVAGSRSVVVQVKDGRLTIGNAAAMRGKLRAVEVVEAYPPQRVISLMTIGFSSPIAADRCVGWSIKTLGWQGFVNRTMQPQLQWGARRIILSNPFGALPDEPMQFDQYLHAKDARLNWLTKGFVQAWKPVTDSGVEVICYLGAIGMDRDFTEASEDEWKARFWASVTPALEAGMSVGLDSASIESADSRAYQAALLLEERGVKVYIEPRPKKELTHWHRFPVITVDQFWHRSNPARHPDSAWAARDEQLTGEVIRLITTPPKGETWESRGWVAPSFRAILQDGHSVAMGGDQFARNGLTPDKLLRK